MRILNIHIKWAFYGARQPENASIAGLHLRYNEWGVWRTSLFVTVYWLDTMLYVMNIYVHVICIYSRVSLVPVPPVNFSCYFTSHYRIYCYCIICSRNDGFSCGHCVDHFRHRYLTPHPTRYPTGHLLLRFHLHYCLRPSLL